MSKLFSKENGEVFSSPLNLNNPIAVQVLGICSALAVLCYVRLFPTVSVSSSSWSSWLLW